MDTQLRGCTQRAQQQQKQLFSSVTPPVALQQPLHSPRRSWMHAARLRSCRTLAAPRDHTPPVPAPSPATLHAGWGWASGTSAAPCGLPGGCAWGPSARLGQAGPPGGPSCRQGDKPSKCNEASPFAGVRQSRAAWHRSWQACSFLHASAAQGSVSPASAPPHPPPHPLPPHAALRSPQRPPRPQSSTKKRDRMPGLGPLPPIYIALFSMHLCINHSRKLPEGQMPALIHPRCPQPTLPEPPQPPTSESFPPGKFRKAPRSSGLGAERSSPESSSSQL